MIPIYLAGPSDEIPRVHYWRDKLSQAGYLQTYDWTIEVYETRTEYGGDGQLEDARQWEYTNADLTAICESEVVWILWPKNKSHGASAEMGCVYGLRKAYELFGSDTAPPHLLVSGSNVRDHIFTSGADERFTNDQAAYEYLTKYAKQYQ